MQIFENCVPKLVLDVCICGALAREWCMFLTSSEKVHHAAVSAHFLVLGGQKGPRARKNPAIYGGVGDRIGPHKDSVRSLPPFLLTTSHPHQFSHGLPPRGAAGSKGSASAAGPSLDTCSLGGLEAWRTVGRWPKLGPTSGPGRRRQRREHESGIRIAFSQCCAHHAAEPARFLC